VRLATPNPGEQYQRAKCLHRVQLRAVGLTILRKRQWLCVSYHHYTFYLHKPTHHLWQTPSTPATIRRGYSEAAAEFRLPAPTLRRVRMSAPRGRTIQSPRGPSSALWSYWVSPVPVSAPAQRPKIGPCLERIRAVTLYSSAYRYGDNESERAGARRRYEPNTSRGIYPATRWARKTGGTTPPPARTATSAPGPDSKTSDSANPPSQCSRCGAMRPTAARGPAPSTAKGCTSQGGRFKRTGRRLSPGPLAES
jgi:hypothetical protein